VLDLQMPGMDQMDLFAILRKEYPSIPALVVSGVYSGLVDDFKAKGYDTITFFNKPAALIDLKKSIFKILKIDALGAFLTDKEVG
jgi:DNA-binding NtrC family response regulator